ncbi:MAG: hypothetical protein RI967_1286 [Planctomycetota bacterium]
MPVVRRNSVPNPDRALRAPSPSPTVGQPFAALPIRVPTREPESDPRASLGCMEFRLHGTSRAPRRTRSGGDSPPPECRGPLGCPPLPRPTVASRGTALRGSASGHAVSARLRGARPAGDFSGASPAGRSRSRDTWPSPGSSRGRFSRFARGRRREGLGTVLATTLHVGFPSASRRLHVGSSPIRPASGPASQTGDPPEKRRVRDGHGPQRRNG